MATSPALGMDTYVPNDTVRAKPDWAALTAWVVGAKHADGGMPAGIKGEAPEDWLTTAFVMGRKRATIAPRDTSVNFILGDCFVRGRGQSKNVVVLRTSSSGDMGFGWYVVLSAGKILAQNSAGRLVYFEAGKGTAVVDLSALGFPDNDVLVDILTVIVAGIDEAYLIGKIGQTDTLKTLYRFKRGVVTPVEFLLTFPAGPAALTSLDGINVNTQDVRSGFDGKIVFRGWTSTFEAVHFGVAQGQATVNLWSIQLGHVSLEDPIVISERLTLTASNDQPRVTSFGQTVREVTLYAIDGTNATPVAVSDVTGLVASFRVMIAPIGNEKAIVAMPATFATLNPINLIYKSQTVLAVSGYTKQILLTNVKYTREVKVIPLGAGTALIFLVAEDYDGGFGSNSRPEIHYYDGSSISLVSPSGIWPDVTGVCFGFGAAAFVTGNTDTADPPTWYRYNGMGLSLYGVDPNWEAGVVAHPLPMTGYLGNGVGIISRMYASSNVVVSSHIWVFGAPGGDAVLPFKVLGEWQTVKSITSIDGAAIIVSASGDVGDTPTEYHYSYLLATTIDNMQISYIGSIDAPLNGSIPPTVQLSARAAVIQLREGAAIVLPGSTEPNASQFNMSIISPPPEWVDGIGPVGEQFIMFSPSTVRDLRPSVLASSGQI